MPESERIVFGRNCLAIEYVLVLADGSARAESWMEPECLAGLELGWRLLTDALARGEPIYGVNTGVGDSCGVPVLSDRLSELPYASALTAEALKLCMPASVFSRSAENHNQNKVSMGTIAARDALRILELSETVAVIHLIALCRAPDPRGLGRCRARSALHAAVAARVPPHDRDRAMEADIAAVLKLHRAGALPAGEIDFAS